MNTTKDVRGSTTPTMKRPLLDGGPIDPKIIADPSISKMLGAGVQNTTRRAFWDKPATPTDPNKVHSSHGRYNNNYQGYGAGGHYSPGNQGGYYGGKYTPPAPPVALSPAMRKVLAESNTTTTMYLRDTYVPSHSLIEIVAAGDGIFKVNNHKVFTLITKISDEKNKQLDDYLVGRNIGFNLQVPKVPFAAIKIIYSFFFDIFEGVNNTSAESEAMAQVFFAKEGYAEFISQQVDEIKNGVIPVDEQFFVYIPPQSISHANVTYDRTAILEGNYVCVLDIHSHDSMSAFFSGTDDADEQEPRFYGVFGGMPWITKDQTCWVMRYQTKSNNELTRHNCDFFEIVDKPQIEMRGLTASIGHLLTKGKFDTQTLLKFYAEELGRLETSHEVLDRCKLTRSNVGKYPKSWGSGYDPDDYAGYYGGMDWSTWNKAHGAQDHRAHGAPAASPAPNYKNIYEAPEDDEPFTNADLAFWQESQGLTILSDTGKTPQSTGMTVTEIPTALDQTLDDLKQNVPITTLVELATIMQTKNNTKKLKAAIFKIVGDIAAVMQSPDFNEDDLNLTYDELIASDVPAEDTDTDTIATTTEIVLVEPVSKTVEELLCETAPVEEIIPELEVAVALATA